MAGARYQEFNDLPASQYQMLREDIAARGIVNPILVDENDVTIDGHQRRRACAELSIDCPRVVIEGLTEDEKKALAIAVNLFRRHLAGVERSTAVHKLSQLGMSQRRIAAATGLGLGTVNRELSGVPNGTPEPPEGVDGETGEITATSSSGQSDGESSDAAGSGNDEQNVSPAPSPTPEPASRRVKGSDDKWYPANKPKAEPSELDRLAEKVSKSDIGYRAATSKEVSKVRSGLLTLDAERSAAVCLPDDRNEWLAFITDVGEWLDRFDKALRNSNLRSVK